MLNYSSVIFCLFPIELLYELEEWKKQTYRKLSLNKSYSFRRFSAACHGKLQ
jgi:hypothetical protein